MSKLNNIIQGWKNVLITDEFLEPFYKSRYEKCINCENMIVGVCKLCGCPCWAKSHAPEENCPDYQQKWLPRHYVDNDCEYVLKSEIPQYLQEFFVEDEINLQDWLDFLTNKNKEEI